MSTPWRPEKFANDLDFAELRVSGTTSPKELAGSIAYNIEQGKAVALAAIGHQAIGQALKSVPIVNAMMVAHGFILTVLPWFDIKIIPDGEGAESERTVLMMGMVKARPF